MKRINQEDEKNLQILQDVTNLICETVPVDFYEAIELAGKITEYIVNAKSK